MFVCEKKGGWEGKEEPEGGVTNKERSCWTKASRSAATVWSAHTWSCCCASALWASLRAMRFASTSRSQSWSAGTGDQSGW